MCLDDVTAIDFVGSNSAVIGSLGSWKPIFGPPKGVSVHIQEGVLLLDPEPWMMINRFVHNFLGSFPMVGLGWSVVILECLTHHHDVVSTSEWIWIHLDWMKIGVGVTSFCLIGGTSIIIPDWQILDTCWLAFKSFGLVSDTLSTSINPNIESLDPFETIK